jgi:hypothetical protein
VHPDVQDPKVQISPDTWIMEIQTYLKDNILSDDMTSADRITRLAKSCSQRSMEVSAGTMHLPTSWSVKPFGIGFSGIQLSRTPSSW